MKINNLWKWGMFIMYISLPFYFMKKCMTNTSNTSFVKGYYCFMYSVYETTIIVLITVLVIFFFFIFKMKIKNTINDTKK